MFENPHWVFSTHKMEIDFAKKEWPGKWARIKKGWPISHLLMPPTSILCVGLPRVIYCSSFNVIIGLRETICCQKMRGDAFSTHVGFVNFFYTLS